MAISTFGVFLMHKASASADYTKLLDIKEFPDLGGEPELLETTTTSDYMQKFIPGIQQLDNFTFTANYTQTDYIALRALEGLDEDYAIWFGYSGTKENPTPDGHDGKWSFKGQLTVFANGGGVNEVVNMTISIAPSTVLTFAQGTT